MQAGVYRASTPIIPPSAAWGLVCNLAGFDRDAGPPMRIVVGNLQRRRPTVSTLYQQLHGYPVGSSEKGAALAANAHGHKYWIAPVRREIIVGLDVMIGIEADGFRQRVIDGLDGKHERYGLPFAGDNNCLLDRVDVLDAPITAWWYVPVGGEPRPGSHRLTVAINRTDSSRTTAGVYAPVDASEPPEAGWTMVG